MDNARQIVAKVCDVMRRRGIKVKDLPDHLNKYLSAGDKITSNQRSAAVQTSRWLDHQSLNWVEPKANIILAMSEFLKENQ